MPEIQVKDKLITLEELGAVYDSASFYKVIGPESMVSVSDAIEAKAGKVLANIEPVQAGNGDPSPDNVRPISGWTGANVSRTGINIFNEMWEKGSINIETGAEEPNAYISRTGYISILPSTLYYYIYTNLGNNMRAFYYDINKNFISAFVAYSNNSFTTPDNAAYLRMHIADGNGIPNTSINFPYTDHDYHPGTDNITIPISWQSEAGTVYGGTLDVTTGVLTVTMASRTFNGSEVWTMSNGLFYCPLHELKKLNGYSYAIRCDILKTYPAHYSLTTDNYGISGYNDYADMYPNKNWIYVSVPGVTTADELKAWLANNPIHVTYELATPQTYQLTPTEVEMLLGENNVWADTGDITVGYLRENSLGTGEAIADVIKSLDASHGQMVKTAMTKTFNDAIEVTTPTFSTLPKTFSAVGITTDHELVQDGFAYLSNPSALGSDWSINTGDNEIQISGTCNDSTYIKASFCVKQKTTATA